VKTMETPAWERAAEELVRLVRSLLEDHGDALERALRKSISKDAARAQLRQLNRFVGALEDELWRVGRQADEQVAAGLASHIKKALGWMGMTAGATLLSLSATAAHEALFGAEAQAERVKVCVEQLEPSPTPDATPVLTDLSADEMALAQRDTWYELPRSPGRLRPWPPGESEWPPLTKALAEEPEPPPTGLAGRIADKVMITLGVPKFAVQSRILNPSGTLTVRRS